VSRRQVMAAAAVAVLSAPATAVATPGVVAVAAARALSAPIERGATLVRELPAGYPVCIVDEPSAADPEAGEPRQWWMVQIAKMVFAFMRAGDVTVTTSASASEMCVPGLSRVAPAPVLPDASAEPEGALSRRRPARGVTPGRLLPLDPVRVSLGMMSGAAWLNREVASQRQIGAAGGTFYVTGGLTFIDLITVSGSAGAAFPGDHAPFRQTVVPVLGGDPMSATSSVQVTNYALSVGLRTPLLALKATEAGGAWVIAAFTDYGRSRIAGERGIDNCVDCHTETLVLPGGTFWRVGMDVGAVAFGGFDPGVVLTVSYQRYAPGTALAEELRVGFTFWFL